MVSRLLLQPIPDAVPPPNVRVGDRVCLQFSLTSLRGTVLQIDEKNALVEWDDEHGVARFISPERLCVVEQ
jgi:hypothetical protein